MVEKINEQTEKLEDSVYDIIFSNRHNIELGSHALTALVLKVCKEAGLIFKHDCQNCPKREEDDYGLLCVLTCTEPFEEIELPPHINKKEAVN